MPTKAVLALVETYGDDPAMVAGMFRVSVIATRTRLYYLKRQGLIC